MPTGVPMGTHITYSRKLRFLGSFVAAMLASYSLLHAAQNSRSIAWSTDEIFSLLQPAITLLSRITALTYTG